MASSNTIYDEDFFDDGPNPAALSFWLSLLAIAAWGGALAYVIATDQILRAEVFQTAPPIPRWAAWIPVVTGIITFDLAAIALEVDEYHPLARLGLITSLILIVGAAIIAIVYGGQPA